MRYIKEITGQSLQSAKNLLLCVIASVLMLTPLILPHNQVYAQNANERDIKLPQADNSNLPSIYLIGDSTVRTGTGDGTNGQWGWGSFLDNWFDTDRVNVVNRAIGGRSSRTYITQGYWKQQLELLNPGDVVLIQFGHNDASPINDSSRARGVLDGIGDEREHIANKLTGEEETVYTYGEYLRTYISDIRDKGATPIICSPVPTYGEVIGKLDDFATWAEQVATAEGVAFLNLNEIISLKYEEAGQEQVEAYFVDDRVHTTREGAQFSAKMVVAALKGLQRNPVAHLISVNAEDIAPETGNDEASNRPLIKGYSERLFEVGELIYSNDFSSDKEWHLQMEETETASESRVDYHNGFLEVLMPGRGATIWNKIQFNGNIAITYKVKAPSTYVNELGVVVRDINVFWHASHPGNPEAIFNDRRYDGSFPSYHKLQGYYASTGGRDNTTTRFRRYPRENLEGEPIKHISLADKDGLQEYLIRPDKTHTVQLVVFDDVIQYVVDDKVVYEIREGDTVHISKADGTVEEMQFTADQFPAYEEGWFGFRLVNTHHLYSNFRVYRLIPDHR